MSRIGKNPVSISAGVTITIAANTVTAQGKKGELTMNYEPQYVSITQEEGQVKVERVDDSKTSRSRHGLYRSLIRNLIEGVSNGFEKKMEIKGVGYRGKVNGDVVELDLGFSHPVHHKIPAGIEVKFNEKSQILFTVSGIDKQKVGQVAAEIRSYRPPEPYKGKGIRYVDEYVLRKAGKSGKA